MTSPEPPMPPSLPTVTIFDPWYEVVCQQGCPVPRETTRYQSALDVALLHVEVVGHETALIEHRSTHYKRATNAS